MGDSQPRPRAGPPPDVTGPLDLLRELLQIERDRLEVARRIEEERKIVFPETSVIVRDILRIQAEIERREAGPVTTDGIRGGSEYSIELDL